LDAVEGVAQPAGLVGADVGDADDVAAAIGRVGGAHDEPSAGQVVDGRDDVAAVDGAAAAEVGLTGRAVLGERGEQPVVVAAEVVGGEALAEQAGGMAGGLVEQPGRGAAEPGG
jgi:hypothetical protein